MDEVEEAVNEKWMEELELALRDEQIHQNNLDLSDDSETTPSSSNKHKIAETLRPDLWKKYLDIEDKCSRNLIFTDIYDLPEQNQLREDCKQVVAKLGNEDEDKVSVLSDLESVLTHFCKSDKRKVRKYEKDNGWIELLFPVLALKLPKQDTYYLFEAIHTKYIARHHDVFHTLTLLILYHDPYLCNFLVTKKITSTHLFTKSWFQTMFAAQCNLQVVHAIWDLYFMQEDPFFIFFLALVIIVNARDQILALKDEPKNKIIEALIMLPSVLEAEDVSDFCSLAQYYDNKTPYSFKSELKSCLFENELTTLDSTFNDKTFISQALALPVSAEELLHYTRNSLDYREDAVRFFLIDCRPAQQYNNGHLPTAFHLDSNLMLQEPGAFATAVQGLLSCQKAAIKQNSQAGGEHICFLGCGQLEDDQYTHMVVSSYLQKQIQYISLVRGGYQAVHMLLEENNSLNESLVDHNSSECLVCNSSPISNNSPTKHVQSNGMSSSTSSDLFGKIGAAMKSKSAEVKEKLFEIMSTPSSSSSSTPSNEKFKTAKKASQTSKRYRSTAPVFSIDDDHDPGDIDGKADDEDDDDDIDSYNTKATWLKRPDVRASFECHQITMHNQVFDSVLLLTDTHLIVLRDVGNKQGYVEMIVNRRLATIGKITSKKKHPEYITLQYSTPNSSDPSDMDRFLISKSKEATEILSKLILKCIDREKDEQIKNNDDS